MNDQNKNIIIYQNEDGGSTVEVRLSDDTVWLSLDQMAQLFSRDVSVIGKHCRNIFKDDELSPDATMTNFPTVAADGKTYQVAYYNLDVIISVGYRVNSKRGIQVRKWASRVLKEYLVQGYSLNHQRLTTESVNQLRSTVDLLVQTLSHQDLVTDMGVHVLEIIKEYAKTWEILLRYDENRLALSEDEAPQKSDLMSLDYSEAVGAIVSLKRELMLKKEATEFFGQERTGSLQGILGNIAQSFASQPVYPSHEIRAAHVLYLTIKNHPFVDGNKRIAALLFLMYLQKTGLNLKLINNNSLIALTLLIAESAPDQKEIMVRLIINLLNFKKDL